MRGKKNSSYDKGLRIPFMEPAAPRKFHPPARSNDKQNKRDKLDIFHQVGGFSLASITRATACYQIAFVLYLAFGYNKNSSKDEIIEINRILLLTFVPVLIVIYPALNKLYNTLITAALQATSPEPFTLPEVNTSQNDIADPEESVVTSTHISQSTFRSAIHWLISRLPLPNDGPSYFSFSTPLTFFLRHVALSYLALANGITPPTDPSSPERSMIRSLVGSAVFSGISTLNFYKTRGIGPSKPSKYIRKFLQKFSDALCNLLKIYDTNQRIRVANVINLLWYGISKIFQVSATILSAVGMVAILLKSILDLSPTINSDDPKSYETTPILTLYIICGMLGLCHIAGNVGAEMDSYLNKTAQKVLLLLGYAGVLLTNVGITYSEWLRFIADIYIAWQYPDPYLDPTQTQATIGYTICILPALLSLEMTFFTFQDLVSNYIKKSKETSGCENDCAQNTPLVELSSINVTTGRDDFVSSSEGSLRLVA